MTHLRICQGEDVGEAIVPTEGIRALFKGRLTGFGLGPRYTLTIGYVDGAASRMLFKSKARRDGYYDALRRHLDVPGVTNIATVEP